MYGFSEPIENLNKRGKTKTETNLLESTGRPLSRKTLGWNRERWHFFMFLVDFENPVWYLQNNWWLELNSIYKTYQLFSICKSGTPQNNFFPFFPPRS